MSVSPASTFSQASLKRRITLLRYIARRRRRSRVFFLGSMIFILVAPMAFPFEIMRWKSACGQYDSARNQAYELEKSLDIYKIMHGDYPPTLESLQMPVASRRAILESVPKDSWGRPYLYLKPGVQNPRKFDIVSAGADGVFFTEDDIGNWPEDEPRSEGD